MVEETSQCLLSCVLWPIYTCVCVYVCVFACVGACVWEFCAKCLNSANLNI